MKQHTQCEKCHKRMRTTWVAKDWHPEPVLCAACEGRGKRRNAYLLPLFLNALVLFVVVAITR
jgi:NAD-dependent SIR2 family protein deacetylase